MLKVESVPESVKPSHDIRPKSIVRFELYETIGITVPNMRAIMQQPVLAAGRCMICDKDMIVLESGTYHLDGDSGDSAADLDHPAEIGTSRTRTGQCEDCTKTITVPDDDVLRCANCWQKLRDSHRLQARQNSWGE